MRIISLLMLLIVSNCTLFSQVSNTRELLMNMLKAESDEAFIKAFHDVQNVPEERLNMESDSIQYLYHYCYAGGLETVNGDKADKIQHINKAIQIRETKIGIFNSEYIELLWALGNDLEDSDVDRAIGVYEKALIKGQFLFNMDKMNPKVRHWYGQCLKDLAHCFEIKKYHTQVVQAYRAAFSLLKDQYDKDDASSYLPLYLLSCYYGQQRQDYEKAISVMNEVMQYIKEHEGEHNKRYAECLYSIAADFGKQKDYDKAIKNYQEAINILKSCATEYDADLGSNYSNLFLTYIAQGNIEKASELRPILIDYYCHNNQEKEYANLLGAGSKIVPKEKAQQYNKAFYDSKQNVIYKN